MSTEPLQVAEQPCQPRFARRGTVTLAVTVGIFFSASALTLVFRRFVSAEFWFSLAALCATWKFDYRFGIGLVGSGLLIALAGQSTFSAGSSGGLWTNLVLTGCAVASLEVLRRTRSRLEKETAERRRIAEALESAEAEFRATFEFAAVGKVQADPVTGRFLRVNRKFCQIVARSADELLGKTFFDITHPDDRAWDETEFRRLVEGKAKFIHRNNRYLRPDGQAVWVNVNANLARDTEGRPLRVYGLIQDISVQKEAEEELRRSASRYRRLFETAHHGIWQVDRKGATVYANERLAEMLGIAPEQLVGRCASDFIRPSDFSGGVETFTESLHNKGATARWQLKRADGSRIWTLSSANPVFDDAGKIVGAFALLTDITEYMQAEQALHESEAQLRVISEAIPDLVFMWDRDGRCDYVSRRFQEFSGISRLESWLAGFHPEDSTRLEEHLRSGLESGLAWSCKLRLRNGEQVYRWFMIKAVPLRTASGAALRWFGAATDIDPLVRAEETLSLYVQQHKKLSRQLLELQEAERRNIARELHDQVGQSLSLVELHLQGMQLQAGESPLKQQLNECYMLVEKVIEQIQKLSFDLRPTMLDDLGLIPALRWYTNQARLIGLNAIFASEPREMRLDPGLETTCYRIVQEALTNVIRHAKAKWVCVDLRQSANELHVSVCDNGNGFDVNAVRQQGGGKHCLGLLGMEERAALAGGRLQIHSVPNHGTEVHASFPLHDPSPVTTNEPS